ncbi:SAV_6107 family HEPN domain-containing protein [Saccharothrix sp. ST-888]|uniref:SAV_6107 family HEPN domain-containing protein n=1 Tax=Saccharothrix sp. ST-888 TaxID=1427391 RepID=UPI000A6ACB63|nr:SAV_6107 family HEPN domain-containing protein [Saccharothrix sp. ST-888]
MTISHPETVTRRPSADSRVPAPQSPLPPAAPPQSPPQQTPLPLNLPPSPAPRGRGADIHPVLRRAAAPPAALDLLRQADLTLVRASQYEDPLERYAAAHLAALRTTAAVLAVRGRPERNPRRRRAIRSAWDVLPEVAPELAEWAVYFAAGARRRAAAEAGIRGAATAREADDLIRNTALYHRIVQRLLGLHPDPQTRPLPPDRRAAAPGDAG